jgi:hypothetical protein
VAAFSLGAVDFKATRDVKGRWNLSFAHWAGSSGVLLEVIHTSTRVVPDIMGTVEGFRPIKSLGRITTGSLLPESRRRFYRFAPLGGVILTIAGMWGVTGLHAVFDIKNFLALLLMAPGEILLLSSGMEYLWSLRIPGRVRKLNGRK